MEARSQLAGIDYNWHLNRAYNLNSSGVQLQRRYSKRSRRESAAAVKGPKDYAYERCLMHLVHQFAQNQSLIPEHARQPSFDPTVLGPTIRGVVSTPTTKLAQNQMSRF